jgi:hypothetical protein
MNLIAHKGHAMEHLSSLSPLWNASRDDLRTCRAARASHQKLERELATYTTAAEQNEINAILDRADPDAAAEIRAIVNRVRLA